MKKITKLITILVTLIILCVGCAAPSDVEYTEDNEQTMVAVERGLNYLICKHRTTGVYYFAFGDDVCVMVNADGTPYTGR